MVDSMLTKVMVQSLIQNALGATEVSKTNNYDASPIDVSWARRWPRNTMLYIHMCFEDS